MVAPLADSISRAAGGVYQRELERLTASRYSFFTRIEMIMTLLLAAPFVLILAVTLKQWPF